MEWVPVVADIHDVLFTPGVLDKPKRPGSATDNLAQVGNEPQHTPLQVLPATTYGTRYWGRNYLRN